MKRIVGVGTTAMLVGMLAAPAVAQQIVLQPEIGINFAKVSDLGLSAGESSSSRTGFAAGMAVLFGLSQQFSVGVGGYYSQQGVKIKDSSGEGTIKLDYIQVPLTLGISFPTGSSVTPSIFAGPMLGFKSSCKVSAEGVSANCDDPNVDIAVKSTDFGILFGGGLGIRAGTGMFVVNAYYDLGLTDINDSPSQTSEQKPKNRMFGFGVGYAFPLGGGGM